jgi:hypothetical protein
VTTAALGPRWPFFASLWFWCHVARETIARRHLSRVVEQRLRGRAIASCGADVVPHHGGFVLAVNHYHAGLTIDVVSAALASAAQARPAVDEECTVIVGQRAAPLRMSRWRAFVRWTAARFLARWEKNVLRIPTGRAAAGLGALRAWRKRAAVGPILVFPEGVANGQLDAMREGAGRWLSSLGVPVIPVGVWWAEERWNVAFGAALEWSRREPLRDVQLGLAMAELLPAELAPEWIEPLAKWRAAHARE